MHVNSDKQLLLRALRLNALFSGASALALFSAAGWIATQLGLDDTVLVYATAVVLVLFALKLANIVRTGVVRSWEIAGIIGADIAWVAASLVLVAIFYGSLTTVGLILVDAVAVVVLVLAIQQYRGLRVFQHGVSG